MRYEFYKGFLNADVLSSTKDSRENRDFERRNLLNLRKLIMPLAAASRHFLSHRINDLCQ